MPKKRSTKRPRFSLQKMICNGDPVFFLDNGVRAVEEIKYIKECGCDVVVLDHHEPGEVLAIVLSIAIIFSLTGCSGSNKEIENLMTEFENACNTLQFF